jgi:hypothetical protein
MRVPAQTLEHADGILRIQGFAENVTPSTTAVSAAMITWPLSSAFSATCALSSLPGAAHSLQALRRELAFIYICDENVKIPAAQRKQLLPARGVGCQDQVLFFTHGLRF